MLGISCNQRKKVRLPDEVALLLQLPEQVEVTRGHCERVPTVWQFIEARLQVRVQARRRLPTTVQEVSEEVLAVLVEGISATREVGQIYNL